MVFRKVASVGMVGIIGLGMMGTAVLAAPADDSEKVHENNVDINVLSGGLHLDIPEIVNFEDVVITGEKATYFTSFDRTGNTAGDLRVSDLRGTAAGWSVKVDATQFENTEGHKLPTGSLSLEGVKAVPALDGTSTNMPTAEHISTQVIDEGAILIANATPENGLGVYGIQFEDDNLGLTVDAKSALVGNYTSTLTWTLESTPQIN